MLVPSQISFTQFCMPKQFSLTSSPPSLPLTSHTGASSTPLYAYSPVGLFPCPLGPSTRFSIVEEVCSKFRVYKFNFSFRSGGGWE